MSPRSQFARSLECLYDQQIANHLADGLDPKAARDRAYIATVEAGHAALAILRGTEHDPLADDA